MLQGKACSVEDASLGGATNKHTTIVAISLSGGRYDLRFYE